MGADVQQAHAQLPLVGQERGLGGGNRLQHRLGHLKSRPVGAGHRALQRAAGAGGNVQVHLQPLAHHAHGVEDALLAVEDELAVQQVQNLAIRRPLDAARPLHNVAHVLPRRSPCGRLPSSNPPLVLSPRICGPPTPTTHSPMLARAIRSACSLAAFTALAAGASSAISPLRIPADSATRARDSAARLHSTPPPARASTRCRCPAPRSGCPDSGSWRSLARPADAAGRVVGAVFCLLTFSAARLPAARFYSSP